MSSKLFIALKQRFEVGTVKETDFYPAALEIIEAPASPLGRMLGRLIILLFTVALLWVTLGSIDIIAVAQGKIIPSDHSKIIQPLEAGVVKLIHVRDGQYVHRGDLLVELDSTSAGAEAGRAINERMAAQVEAARWRALLDGKTTFEPPFEADPQYLQLQGKLLLDQLNESQARTEQIRLVIEQKQASIAGIKSNLTRLEAIVPILTQRAQKLKQLLDQHFVTEVEYLDIEQQRITKQQELAAERHHLVQETASLSEAKRNHQGVIAEYKNKWRSELSTAEVRATSLGKEVVKAETRTKQQTLQAPIDGVVQQLAIHTVGGVVTPAQQLLVIAPNEGQLEIEAYVENKDIGFIEAGQEAEIKIEAFPFTRYGVIAGKVLHLSQDAVAIDKVGLMYTTRVGMQSSEMVIDNGKRVKLNPGMNATVEIKTGKRRLIEYFLSPLIKGFKETAHER
ncbi:MAG: HlyD family type I secretion periplasmic adaptor subunit [Gammaproteobacteria bacterium]|nr:HlyD family type I secretion periplasmic adaptor subunit [Gammaproteobacteria bacterium]